MQRNSNLNNDIIEETPVFSKENEDTLISTGSAQLEKSPEKVWEL